MKRVFHYTTMEHCQGIFIDGEIKTAVLNVPKGVKPVVWFTTNPDWEETAKQAGSNPKQWLVSYENVHMDAVIGVSSWDGEKWEAWRKAE